jgi:UDP-2,4-diacetamido-2,4,6-trideoxy-beta-L-altropyranose hydrolase
MRTAILTNAGKSIGLGHLGRCMALAQAVESIHNVKPIFLGLDSISSSWVGERDFPVSKEVSGIWDLLIADLGEIPAGEEESLKNLAAEILMIHDVGGANASCDWILNGSIYAQEISYAKSSARGLLLGPRFQPLRKEFWYSTKLTCSNQVEDVVIILGGSNVEAALAFILRMAGEALPTANLHVVTGPHVKIPQVGSRVIQHQSPFNIRSLIESCDLAISAGGQGLYELAFCGVPVIAIPIANNQIPNVMAFSLAGAAISVGQPSDANFDVELKRAIISLAEDLELRISLGEAGRKLVDGQGALRAIRAIYPSPMNGENVC